MDHLPADVQKIVKDKNIHDLAIKVLYKNYKGEVAERSILPMEVLFGSNEYHTSPQWLLKVFDLEKKDYRTYALKDIQRWIHVP